MLEMERILEKINENYTEKDGEMLVKAYHYAEEAHANQKRASGEPYFIHPCEVADILIDLGLDAATIAAALLHDVIEDTESTAEDIQREFIFALNVFVELGLVAFGDGRLTVYRGVKAELTDSSIYRKVCLLQQS